MMETTSQRGRHVCATCGLHFALKVSLKAHAVKYAHQPPSNDNDSDSVSAIIGYLDTPQPSSSSTPERHTGSSLHLDEKITGTLSTHQTVRGPQIFSSSATEIEKPSASLPPTTSGNFFRCVSCLKVFDSRAKLTQHQTSKSHKGVAELKTKPEDVKKTNSATSLKGDGVENISFIENELPYNCASCKRFFDSEDKLQQHKASVGHLNKVKSKSEAGLSHVVSESRPTASALVAVFPCLYPRCGKSFDNPSKLLQHQIMKKHRDQDIAKDPELSKLLPQNLHEDQSFICEASDCGRAFPNEDRLLQHKKDKHKITAEARSDTNSSSEFAADFLAAHGIPALTPYFQLPMVENLKGMESDDGYTSTSVDPPYHEQHFDRLMLGGFSAKEAGGDSSSVDEQSVIEAISTPVREGSPASTEHSTPQATPARVRVFCDKCESFNEAAEKKNFIFLTFVAKHILKEHPPPNYTRGFCPICNKRIDKMKNILTHIARSHLLNKFPEEACFICLRLCKDKNDLQQHTTAVHRFKCLIDDCNSMFPSMALRDKHMLQKHGVHACTHEGCQAILKSIEDKQRHILTPHPVDSDSDPSVMLTQAAFFHRPLMDPTFFSEPPGAVASNQSHESHPYSADEKLSSVHRNFDTSQNAAHRLFKNSLKHFQTTLVELREPLRRPVNPLCVDETIILCDELIAELTEIRNRYQMNYSEAEQFDIDLLYKG